jgi:hypothetical protein
MGRTANIYTAAELKAFDRLTQRLSDRDQMKRISARLYMPAFIEKHGKEKCDAMFEALKHRDAKRAQTTS